MRRRIRALAAALALSAVLSGCGGFQLEFNPEALYTLPELPAKYTELNAQLSAILEDGAEYAAPAAGTPIIFPRPTKKNRRGPAAGPTTR